MKVAAKKKRSMRDLEVPKAKRFAYTKSLLFSAAIATCSESESKSVAEEPKVASTNNVEASSTSANFSINEGISNSVYKVADKCGLSNRALTELAAVFHTSECKDLNQVFEDRVEISITICLLFNGMANKSKLLNRI